MHPARLALAVAVLLSPVALARDELKLNDYVGKWDLVLANSRSSFRSASLLIEKGDDGEVSGELVWRWGSVWKFEKADVVTVDDKGWLLVRKGGWATPLKLKHFGAGIEGQVRQNEQSDTVTHVSGSRAVWDVDPTGTWNLRATDRNGETGEGRLVIESDDGRRFRARAYNDQNDEIPIRSVGIEDNRLTVTAAGEESEQSIVLHAEVRGDRLVGEAIASPSGEKILDVKGERTRRWAPPIRLLPENGTQGWRPRDRSRPFKWTCEDGVLANGPHDVDIVSEAEFDDFHLDVEYRVDKPGANSGIYLRGRYEVQIIGNNKVGNHNNGAIYSRLAPTANPFSGAGKWQHLEITLIDRYLTVTLNGEVIHDNVRLRGITGGAIDPYEHLPGPFILQGDHGLVNFRNLEVRPPLR